MTISSYEVVFVGKKFDNEKNLLDYLVTSKVITQEVADDYIERFNDNEGSLEDIIEITHIHNFPALEMEDYALAKFPFLGYLIVTDVRLGTSPEQFKQDVLNAKSSWKNIFGDEVELQSIRQYR